MFSFTDKNAVRSYPGSLPPVGGIVATHLSRRVAPMRVTLKQDADLSQVKAKPRVYPPEKIAWLKEHFELLCETRMVYPNPQAICASVAMAFPKGPGKGYRLVAEFSALNGQCEFVPGPIQKPEIEGDKCVGAVAFCTADYLQGYWQYQPVWLPIRLVVSETEKLNFLCPRSRLRIQYIERQVRSSRPVPVHSFSTLRLNMMLSKK